MIAALAQWAFALSLFIIKGVKVGRA